MTLPDGYTLIPLSQSAHAEVVELDRWAFPTGVPQEDLLKFPVSFDWDRVWGIVHGAPDVDAVPIDRAVPETTSLAAMHASYAFAKFAVPGGHVAASGLTWVGVHPEHRRKGLLSAMIDQHFRDCLERGEAISTLTAAESGIYRRFGYGIGAAELRLTLPRKAPLYPVPGSEQLSVRIEEATEARHGELIDRLHRAAGEHPSPVVGLNRPGWATRETPSLSEYHLMDSPLLREGAETRRVIIVEHGDDARGYATFRRKIDWTDSGAKGTVSVGEVIALDPAAAHRLWSVLLDLDLSHEIKPARLPTDDAIFSLLVDPRSAAARMSDNIWIRVIDVASALAARVYAGDIDLVLHVRDDRLPANTGAWRLTARAFAPATVTRTDDTPDISLSASELGAVYLGGTSLASLAAAGQVTEHRDGAVREAAAAFSWPVAPISSWIF